MYLSNLRLWNFRKYGSNNFDINNPDLNVEFKLGLNVLIGENDSGKTAIVDAIKLVLKTQSYEWIRLNHEDFYNDSRRLRIEVLIKDLSDSEAKNFIEWLCYDNNHKPYLKLVYDVTRTDDRILPADVKAGIDDIGKTLTAEAKEYLKCTYLKPLRDAQKELIPKRHSRISQIFMDDDAFRDHDNHILLDDFKEFNRNIINYFEGLGKDGKTLNDQKGKALKDRIDKYMHNFYNDTAKTEIKTNDANLRKVLESLQINILDTLNPGLGTLNRLFMASELLHLNKENWDGLHLGLIEEIEAHLHPQVQLKVIRSLQEINNIQLIMTTHSPILASKIKIENLILCKNNQAYPMGHQYTQLDASNYIFLEKFLDVTKANLFFARGIIFVEGWAEEILIPIIAKLINCDLTINEVSVINVGNLGFSHYYNIFLRKEDPKLDIPVSVLTDVDVKEYEKSEDDLIQLDKTEYSKIIEKKITDKNCEYEYPIKPFISPEWTLEWCLYKSKTIGSVFKEIVKDKVHTRTNWDKFEETLASKLINQSLKKTHIAYLLSKKIEDEFDIFSKKTIENDNSIKYIVEAIKYACRKN